MSRWKNGQGGHMFLPTSRIYSEKITAGPGHVAQVVQCLPIKHKTLGLNPSTVLTGHCATLTLSRWEVADESVEKFQGQAGLHEALS